MNNTVVGIAVDFSSADRNLVVLALRAYAEKQRRDASQIRLSGVKSGDTVVRLASEASADAVAKAATRTLALARAFETSVSSPLQ